MRVDPMLQSKTLRAEERPRQAARPEVLALELGHLRGEPLGRDEPLDLRGHQIPRAPTSSVDFYTALDVGAAREPHVPGHVLVRQGREAQRADVAGLA